MIAGARRRVRPVAVWVSACHGAPPAARHGAGVAWPRHRQGRDGCPDC